MVDVFAGLSIVPVANLAALVRDCRPRYHRPRHFRFPVSIGPKGMAHEELVFASVILFWTQASFDVCLSFFCASFCLQVEPRHRSVDHEV